MELELASVLRVVYAGSTRAWRQWTCSTSVGRERWTRSPRSARCGPPTISRCCFSQGMWENARCGGRQRAICSYYCRRYVRECVGSGEVHQCPMFFFSARGCPTSIVYCSRWCPPVVITMCSISQYHIRTERSDGGIASTPTQHAFVLPHRSDRWHFVLLQMLFFMMPACLLVPMAVQLSTKDNKRYDSAYFEKDLDGIPKGASVFAVEDAKQVSSRFVIL